MRLKRRIEALVPVQHSGTVTRIAVYVVWVLAPAAIVLYWLNPAGAPDGWQRVVATVIEVAMYSYLCAVVGAWRRRCAEVGRYVPPPRYR